jgi:LmbE family N-acetylglucosaminyl deacetylase
MTTPLSIVIVAAHLDDHWFGMGGTMVKAARKGHRVTVIQAVSVYGAWPVVHGRGAEIKPELERLSRWAGIELRTLGHDYQRLYHGFDLIGQLADAISACEPDLVFCPWPEDANQDHVALGTATPVAALHPRSFLHHERALKIPKQVVQYVLDPNPRSFVPTSFVDVGDVLLETLETNNAFCELYGKHPHWTYDHGLAVTDRQAGGAARMMQAQSEFMLGRAIAYGGRCGTRFADGFVNYAPVPADRDLLGRI